MHQSLFFVSLLLLSCGQPKNIAILDNQPVPKAYVAQYIDAPIQIDGEQESAWQQAAWSEEFIDIEGDKKPNYQTQVKMLWDQNALYILAKLNEPHIWATLRQRDTVIFYNNDFEVFIDPDGDTHDYMELEINALNTVWDLFLNKPYLNKNKVDNQWDIEGLQSAVSYNGTLNDATDIDQSWTLEIALPWKGLSRGNKEGLIPVNQFWRMNFSRVNWDFDLKNNKYYRKKDSTDTYFPEYNWVWSPQWAINMHLPEYWGFVYFSDTPAQKTFVPPKDTALVLWMYSQFRDALAREKDQLLDVEMPQASFHGEIIKIEKMVENDTLFWTAFNPHNQSIYQIRSDGKLGVKRGVESN